VLHVSRSRGQTLRHTGKASGRKAAPPRQSALTSVQAWSAHFGSKRPLWSAKSASSAAHASGLTTVLWTAVSMYLLGWPIVWGAPEFLGAVSA